jgi:hypothetical protein
LHFWSGSHWAKTSCIFFVDEGDDVMRLRLESVHVFTDTGNTETELAAIAELLGGFITKVTLDNLLCPRDWSGHSFLS